MKKSTTPQLTFETIFEQSPISTQIFAPNGETIKVNKAWEKLWNISFAEIKKYNVLKDKQLVEKGIMPYIKRGFKGEVVNIPAIKYEPPQSVDAKNVVPFRFVKAIMYPVRDEHNDIVEIIIQHEDITEHSISEEQLHQSEERLRLALDAGNIGVWDWDIKNKGLTWTDQVYDMHGVSPTNFDVNIDNFVKLIHAEDSKKVTEAIENALSKNAPFNLEFRIKTPDGSERWIATSARVKFNSQGEAIRMLGATTEITQKKRLEQDKNDFISIATHELKTPVTSIKAYAEVLQRRFERAGHTDSAQHLGKMNEQLNKLNHLISDLLDVTKIEAGKLYIHEENFQFDALVKDIVEELQRTTESHTLLIVGDTKKNILADRDRIGQVLTNLIANAIKYSPLAKKIHINLSSDTKSVTVCIQDYGIGIPKEKQKKVFERFYRVSGPYENTFPGLGLGLYISSEIIKRQQGRIWVDSTSKKGSTFCFTIPLKKNKI